MFSFSIEAGHRFHPVNAFFIEPQIEFMYGRVESVDYTTSANYGLKQDAAESLIGRAGFMAGLELPKDKGNVYIGGEVDTDYRVNLGARWSF